MSSEILASKPDADWLHTDSALDMGAFPPVARCAVELMRAPAYKQSAFGKLIGRYDIKWPLWGTRDMERGHFLTAPRREMVTMCSRMGDLGVKEFAASGAYIDSSLYEHRGYSWCEYQPDTWSAFEYGLGFVLTGENLTVEDLRIAVADAVTRSSNLGHVPSQINIVVYEPKVGDSPQRIPEFTAKDAGVDLAKVNVVQLRESTHYGTDHIKEITNVVLDRKLWPGTDQMGSVNILVTSLFNVIRQAYGFQLYPNMELQPILLFNHAYHKDSHMIAKRITAQQAHDWIDKFKSSDRSRYVNMGCAFFQDFPQFAAYPNVTLTSSSGYDAEKIILDEYVQQEDVAV